MSFLFQFHIWLTSKKVENKFYTIFELVLGRKFTECLCVGLIGLIVALGNLLFLKLAYLPSKLRFSGKYLS